MAIIFLDNTDKDELQQQIAVIDKKGGIYVGSGEMPEGYNIQIDPEGDAVEDNELENRISELEAKLNIIPIIGRIDENNNIILTGDLPEDIYTIKYEMGDGSTINIGELVLDTSEETPTTYTNLADPTSADWQEGYRLSISSGTTSELEGHITTNFIPATKGDILRVKGLTINNSDTGGGDTTSPKIVSYNSAKEKNGGWYGTSRSNSSQAYGLMVDVDGDISTYTLILKNDGSNPATSSTAYIRLDGFLMEGYASEDVIITINEEIV